MSQDHFFLILLKALQLSSLCIQQEAPFSNHAEAPCKLAVPNGNDTSPLVLFGVYFASQNTFPIPVSASADFHFLRDAPCLSLLALSSPETSLLSGCVALSPDGASTPVFSSYLRQQCKFRRNVESACFCTSKSGHLSNQDDEELGTLKAPPFYRATHPSLSLTGRIVSTYCVLHTVLGTADAAVSKAGTSKPS